MIIFILFILGVFGGYRLRHRYNRAKIRATAHAEANSHTIQTRLGPVEYIVEGEGPPVLSVHGFMGSCYQGMRIAQPLIERGYQVITLSRPGYLRTPKTLGESPDEQADVYNALLDALQIESVVVVGFSTGGPSVVEFARRYPERVRALVLLGAVSKPLDLYKLRMMDSLSMMMRHLDSDLISWLVTRGALFALPLRGIMQPWFKREVLDKPTKREVYIDSLKMFFPISNYKAGLRMDAHHLRQLPLDGLDTVEAQTLIIHGAMDDTVTPDHSEYHAQQLPNARLHLMDGHAKHTLHITHAEQVWGYMADFLYEINEAFAAQSG